MFFGNALKSNIVAGIGIFNKIVGIVKSRHKIS